VRLKNVSNQAIYPPIRIEVVGYGFPEYENDDDKKRNAENAPTLLNTSNGKGKEGAVVEMGQAIAGADSLQPGALTNPVVLKLQLVDPTKCRASGSSDGHDAGGEVRGSPSPPAGGRGPG
jgi:hypothetical protein